MSGMDEITENQVNGTEAKLRDLGTKIRQKVVARKPELVDKLLEEEMKFCGLVISAITGAKSPIIVLFDVDGTLTIGGGSAKEARPCMPELLDVIIELFPECKIGLLSSRHPDGLRPDVKGLSSAIYQRIDKDLIFSSQEEQDRLMSTINDINPENVGKQAVLMQVRGKQKGSIILVDDGRIEETSAIFPGHFKEEDFILVYTPYNPTLGLKYTRVDLP